jgi:hypothetical protein
MVYMFTSVSNGNFLFRFVGQFAHGTVAAGTMEELQSSH